MYSTITSTKFRQLLIILFSSFLGWPFSANAQFPAFPPDTVNSTMDRDQMLWQMGIAFPVLPSRLLDPNKRPGTFPSNAANPEGNWTDSLRHTITRSPFGLWIQYQNDTGNYTPIDLLKMKDGTPVTTPEQWWNARRPEILYDVQNELFGFFPAASSLPKVTFSITTTTVNTGDSAFIQKNITGAIDVSSYPTVRNVPVISAVLRTPANATGPVPVIIVISGTTNLSTVISYWNRIYPKGFGVCIFATNSLQPDNGTGLTSYLIGLVNKGNWRKPSEWGALGAWSWGISRLVDYLEKDPNVVPSKIGISGHSRYGKAALLAMDYDQRLAIAYPSSAGSLGTKMNRRHWGQDIESSASTSEYHWMAGSFFRWMGPLQEGTYLPRKIEALPVDAHSMVALAAPRPVFLNGGTDTPPGNGEAWQDPTGMYQSGLYASPVYEFLGKKGLVIPPGSAFTSGPGEAYGGTPTMDVAFISGDIGYRRHNQGHTDAPDWPAFLTFAEKYFGVYALPVTLQSFVAERKSSAVTLRWATFSEQNNKGFAILRSKGADWERIGFVASQAPGGNSATANTYNYTDQDAPKVLTQYKLLQVNTDGKEFSSNIQVVKGDVQAGKTIIFPNPSFNGNVKIVFADPDTKNVVITDLSGRMVKSFNEVKNNLEVSGLLRGVYNLQIIDRKSGNKVSEKLMIQ